MISLPQWLIKRLKWQVEASSEIGPHKRVNEDNVCHSQNPTFAIVCDGVGGNACGEIASEMACNNLSKLLSTLISEQGYAASSSVKTSLKTLLRKCHNDLLRHMEQYAETKGMATTVVLAVRQGRYAHIAWAGDSRAYLLRDTNLTQITDDHSFVTEKVAQGIFTQEEAEIHPMANLITSSLGGAANSLKHIGVKTLKLKKRDRLILMSDGVYGYMNDNELLAAARQSAQALTQQAINNDTTDNCSAVCIDIG